jgi:hypothetical protein
LRLRTGTHVFQSFRSGADPAAALELARREVERTLAPKAHSPSNDNWYASAVEDAILASILDQETRNNFANTMLEQALDQRELKVGRWNSLIGLLNIAGVVDRPTQQQLLPGVMEIARGHHTGDHLVPLDADVDLAPLALECAATLKPDADTCLEIEEIGLRHLRSANEVEQWRVVQALVLIPAEYSRLDLAQSAVHPVAAIRAMAAVQWTKNPGALPYERARDFAGDSDYRVRRELAKGLLLTDAPIAEETKEIIAILKKDVRRSLRTLALRVGM